MHQELFDELCFYTMNLGDPSFIHQHAVDAYAVQEADESSKAIAVVFGLAGLYLYLEGLHRPPGAEGPHENGKEAPDVAPARTAD